MTPVSARSSAAWTLAWRQHDVITHAQLRTLGFSEEEIRHRVRTGRLFRLYRGVYAVGRPTVTRHGQLIAAVLRAGKDAALSHHSAAELWGFRPRTSPVTLSVPGPRQPRSPGLRVHRRTRMPATTIRDGIAVTTPAWTLVDVAPMLDRDQLERAINEADRLDLIDPERLRSAVEDMVGVTGAPRLRWVLDRRTFVLTDSALEQRFARIARAAGLALPETRRYEVSFRVDFVWPDLGLIVETDGLRYHRTPAQQARDRLRDQTHTAAGRTPLRFTHEQIRYEPEHVTAILAAVAARLGARPVG